MSTLTLEQLRAYEAKLIKAAANPLKTTWFDEFRKEYRPFAEIAQGLALVRTEIARHPDNPDRTRRRASVIKIRCTSGY